VKSKGLIIAVVVILLLAGGYFLMNKKGPATSPTTSDTSTTETSSGSKSLKDLLSAGIAQKCTYSTTSEGTTTEGTSYIAGGKMRGDFTNTTSGKTTVSHMISDGKTSWIWTEGETTGFKMTVEEPTAGETPSSQTTVEGGVGWDDKFDYKCSAWVTDGTFFTPPSNVKFTDFSELLKGNTGY